VWKDGGRGDRQIGVGMTGRILRSYRRIESAVKVELAQNGVPMSTKLGMQDGRRQWTMRKVYRKIRGKRHFEDETKSCILRHAKHCCRRSSQGQVFFPRAEGDVDRREVLREVDRGKR